jgi:NADPH-dependent ferric siderophore reductase
MTTTKPARPARPVRTATVVSTEQLSASYVRVVLTGDDLAQLPELEHTDHYVKLLFAPPGADYAWPFDPAEIRATKPQEQWPVTRTYTIRSFDRATRRLALDFVVHGSDGLAGPWAAAARPGDTIGFMGPGGAWSPDPDAEVHLLVGDESAAPAIAAALESLAPGTRAEVFLEVADAASHLPVPELPGTTVTWVHRSDAGGAHGQALCHAVRSAGVPEGRLSAFVHGNADMVKDLRRYLFLEQGVPRSDVSISGYWRTGQDEDAWQAGKRAFNEQMEREENQPTG